jgi:selenocysteine lyase/cysteine desulfurase
MMSSRQPEDWSGIVSLIVPGADPRPWVRRCRDTGMVITQRAGRVRVSPHCYNNHEEIDRLLRVLATGVGRDAAPGIRTQAGF